MPTEISHLNARRDAIRQLLSQRKIRTQTELAERLRTLGHAATQSSISRDLREMQVIKDPDGYRLNDSAESAAPDAGLEFVRRVAPAGAHLLVVHTATGAAQRVAVELDRSGWPEIIGTLSGDDTIFIATSGQAANRKLMQRLQPATAGAAHG